MRKPAATRLLVLLCALVAVALLLLLNGSDESETIDEQKLAPLAEQWLGAVGRNDMMTALKIANAICEGAPPGRPGRAALKLAKSEGIDEAFLEAPFNAWDFQLWRSAHFFKRLATAKTKGDPKDIRSLYDAVVARIDPNEKSSPHAAWPVRIWQRGHGVCDRQVWVLCELAYQAGWETQVVYLQDPKTNVSPHTVGELVRDGSVCIVDPFFRKMLPDTSIEQLADDADLLNATWPGRADVREAIHGCRFWTPSFPQDYCPRNQRLQRRLAILLKDRCPRFGVEPAERLNLYRKLRKPATGKRNRFPMELWPYPFRLLRADMARTGP